MNETNLNVLLLSNDLQQRSFRLLLLPLLDMLKLFCKTRELWRVCFADYMFCGLLCVENT